MDDRSEVRPLARVPTESSVEPRYFRALNAVFDLRISSAAKLVLLNLCRRANKHGESFPSHETIAHDCSLSKATVKRALDELAERGHIEIETRRGRKISNYYKVYSSLRPLRKGETAHSELLKISQVSSRIAHSKPENSSKGFLKTAHDELRRKTQLKELSLSEPSEQDFFHFTKEFYAVIGVTTLAPGIIAKGREVLSALFAHGRTAEDVRGAIAYVQRHKDNPAKINRPPVSIAFLPHIIDLALGETSKERTAQSRKAQLEAAEARKRAQLEREAETVRANGTYARNTKVSNLLGSIVSKVLQSETRQ